MNASLPEIVSEPAARVFWKVSFKSRKPFSRLRRNCSSSCLIVVCDAAGALAQLGIRPAHHLGHDGHDLVQERLAPAHLVGVQHGPAQQAPDHITLLLGAGRTFSWMQNVKAPHVIGHAADANAVGMVALVFDAQRAGDRGDDRLEDVGLEDG